MKNGIWESHIHPIVPTGENIIDIKSGSINIIQTKPERIFILEDHPVVSESLERCLIDFWAQRISRAMTISTARQIVWQDLEGFSLVFCDINLPDWKGIDFARELRNSGYQGVLVIISGFLWNDDIEKIQSIWWETYMAAKPIDINVLEWHYLKSLEWARNYMEEWK